VLLERSLIVREHIQGMSVTIKVIAFMAESFRTGFPSI